MKKFVSVFAAIGTVILVGCVNSPGHRIEECEKQGGDEATCTAKEWDYEKVNPLPTYDTTRYDPAAALESSFDAPASHKKSDSKSDQESDTGSASESTTGSTTVSRSDTDNKS